MEIQSGDCRPRPIVTKTSGRAARPGAKDCERDAGASGRARTGGESPAMNSGPKWSLRNGAQYQRLCARAGCGAAAVATLRFQSTERQAWLVDLDVNASRTQGDLCQRHAAALVLPRGWELHDERPSGTWKPVTSSDANAGATPKNGAGTRRKRAPRKAKASAPDALPGLEPAPTVAAPVV